MQFIRNHKKISIFILIFLIIFLLLGVTFGRYIYNIVNNHILETKGFYFNSSILTINNKKYKINNWDGVNSYTLTIDLNNKKNEMVSTTSDIRYEVIVNCPSKVMCTLSKNKGIIYETQKNDSYQITITPTTNFYEGDEVVVKTEVTSTYPYKKTLSATYNIGVEKSKFSYSIEDSENQNYLTLNLTNSVTYYVVEKAFNNYQVGDQISSDKYSELSDSEKSNCYSAKVTIEFDPNILSADMTAQTYHNRLDGSSKTTRINDYDYVSGYSFKVDANSSQKVLFYKKNISKNYTYPIINENSIINVSVVTAE